MPHKDPLARAEHFRQWRERNRERVRAIQARYRARKRREVRARNKLNDAVRRGDVIREPCLFCDTEQVHAHHHDYDKPFDVTWLCAKHHGLIHDKPGACPAGSKP